MEENKKLDDFIRKTIKEVGLEKPSLDFTDLVLSKIQAEEEKTAVFEFQPILSKKAWFIIICAVIALFAYLLLGDLEIEIPWFSISQLNRLTAYNLSITVPDLPISSTFIYGFLIFTFFVVVHVFMLKQRVNRGFDLV